ncbi:MAG: HupE-UreJ family metal transporter [Alphaproteobacteria bacterium]|nr:HupE-UreJ family metal transporter [Alphaproteobacteria bacterium]
MRPARMIAAAALLSIAGPALAHPGHEVGLGGGLMHPLTGPDHLLAMIAVGLFAGMRGGRATWAWPLAFLVSAALGFLAGPGALPLAEPMVLASVLALGLLVATAAPVGLGAGIALVALFGLFHGQAHAAEAGTQAIGAFAVGFLVTSAALHAAGLGLQRVAGPAWGRLAGAATLVGGLALALS